jgi:hypothetical protein
MVDLVRNIQSISIPVIMITSRIAEASCELARGWAWIITDEPYSEDTLVELVRAPVRPDD